MKRICLFTLIICLLTMVNVSAKSVKPEKIDKSKINTKVTYMDKEYDLSSLNDASEYFKITNQISSLQENVDLEQIVKNTKINKQKSGNNTENLTDVTMLSFSGVFDLESLVRTNANIMNSTYNDYFWLYMQIYNYNVITASSNAYMSTGIFFASNVRTGGPWDLKSVYNLDYTTYYQTSINGKTVSLLGDDIGNVHYGYVGSTIFPPSVLLSAAGLVQIAGGQWDASWFITYFDDPRDQLAINRGINYYYTGTFQ